MEGYLTKLARKRAWWEIPAGALSALLGAVAVEVMVEDIQKGLQDPVTEVLAYLMVLALVLLPLFFVGRRAVYRLQAKRIDAALRRRTEGTLPVGRLDGIVGMRDAGKKLNRLADKCYLRRLEFSRDGEMLILDHEPAEQQEPADAPGGGVLERIRALNEAIDDAGVSDRIDRIEALTASIFDTVRQRPERADEARRFANYYLPVTLKLLESYSLMEKQSYQGENIQSSREKIEAALGKLEYAIAQQQDRLYRSEAMDVEAEIQVLDTMMRSDGTIG